VLSEARAIGESVFVYNLLLLVWMVLQRFGTRACPKLGALCVG
jgi:hypothetical protein